MFVAGPPAAAIASAESPRLYLLLAMAKYGVFSIIFLLIFSPVNGSSDSFGYLFDIDAAAPLRPDQRSIGAALRAEERRSKAETLIEAVTANFLPINQKIAVEGLARTCHKAALLEEDDFKGLGANNVLSALKTCLNQGCFEVKMECANIIDKMVTYPFRVREDMLAMKVLDSIADTWLMALGREDEQCLEKLTFVIVKFFEACAPNEIYLRRIVELLEVTVPKIGLNRLKYALRLIDLMTYNLDLAINLVNSKLSSHLAAILPLLPKNMHAEQLWILEMFYRLLAIKPTEYIDLISQKGLLNCLTLFLGTTHPNNILQVAFECTERIASRATTLEAHFLESGILRYIIAYIPYRDQEISRLAVKCTLSLSNLFIVPDDEVRRLIANGELRQLYPLIKSSRPRIDDLKRKRSLS